MASFDAVNYSIRPSKSIERQLVFDGISRLKPHLDLDDMAYVGFGSVWFTDFVLAHRHLGIEDMVSIERDDIGYRRASFNAPYATVRVLHGDASEMLPTLYDDETMKDRPWLVWLDYDYEFEDTLKKDIVSVVENAPVNSILIVTFNGHEQRYGDTSDRPAHLRDLFGASVPDDLPKIACKRDRMQQTLADFAQSFMLSTAAEIARPGGFVPAFRVVYRDDAPMVTVGGLLPSKGASRIAADIVGREDWPCRPPKPILAPHLTLREAAALQSLLPRKEPLDRGMVRDLGFDLDERQLEAFEAYYRHYPSFAQVLA